MVSDNINDWINVLCDCPLLHLKDYEAEALAKYLLSQLDVYCPPDLPTR